MYLNISLSAQLTDSIADNMDTLHFPVAFDLQAVRSFEPSVFLDSAGTFLEF